MNSTTVSRVSGVTNNRHKTLRVISVSNNNGTTNFKLSQVSTSSQRTSQDRLHSFIIISVREHRGRNVNIATCQRRLRRFLTLLSTKGLRCQGVMTLHIRRLIRPLSSQNNRPRTSVTTRRCYSTRNTTKFRNHDQTKR